jgi:hypothetical protein
LISSYDPKFAEFRIASLCRKTCLNLIFPWFLAEMLLEDRTLPEGFP